MEISSLAIDREYFSDLAGKVVRNEDIAVFYDHLFNESGDFSHFYRAKGIRVCGRFWDTDYYRLQQVKDIKRVNLCRDKFCFNCQCMLAIKRQAKYMPILDSLYSNYTFCHMVVTIPNVTGEELLPSVEKMYKKFKHLTRLLSGDKKVHNLDFLQYGYAGGLRALEVSFNRDRGDYHPHFHVILLLRKNLDFGFVKYRNCFSYDRGMESRRFTRFEVLIQKVWYLLMNDIPVTFKAIEDLKEGYSVYIEPVKKGQYHEVFKYACKGSFNDGSIYDEENFKVLFGALFGRRMIQGYGILHNFKDLEGEILEEDLQQHYDEMIAQLRSLEDPIFKIESLEEVLSERNCRYISKSNLKRLLIAQRKEEARH